MITGPGISVVSPAAKRRIAQALAERKRTTLGNQALVPSGVLVPVFAHGAELYLVFTRRHDRLPHHAGQFSFPGGVREPVDPDLRTTALREAYEEIGIAPEDVEVLGELNPDSTRQGFAIAPFVGAIPHPYPFRLAAREVTAVLEVPLPVLMEPRWETKELGQKVVTSGPWYQYNGQVVWGATARIVKQFVDLLKGSPVAQDGKQ